MADKKISALPAATVPLAGTEVLPVVQSGATDKVSVANLTSGRTIDFAGSYATNATAATFRGYSIGGADTATEFGSLKMEVSTGVMRLAAGFTGWGGQLALSTDGVDRVTVSTAGNATLNTGNLVVGTAGKGIDFSANANAPGMTSEVLDWYEEGTWTPTAASASGTITTYTSSGRYTRVGNLVYVTGVVGTADIGTASGKMTVGGLPFAGAPNYQSGLAHEVINTGTSYFCALADGATSFTIQTFANGGITWGNASQYHFSFVYRV